MYPGYDLHSEVQTQNPNYQFNSGSNDFQKAHHASHDHKHHYNLKAPSFESSGEGFQIPPHLRMLFETENKPVFDAKPHMNTGSNANLATNTHVASHTTIDSRRSNGDQDGHRYPSFNTLLNQSNEFNLMKNVPNDLNTSNLSDNKDISLNNLSRDSGYRGGLNTSNSRRNMSSKSSLRAKNYQVQVNEDIKLIERIETTLNQIIANHNKTCPFCNKLIDVKKSNFQNVSSFYSNTSKRYYLTHFDCYLKATPIHSSCKVLSLAGVCKAAINTQMASLPAFESTNFLRLDRRAYFLNIEGFHPLSTHTLFKLEKIAYALEHHVNKTQLLYLNLDSKSSCIFEPNQYMLPFSEFRLVITVHLTHSTEDPYVYEFLVDLSSVKVNADQKSKYAEAYFPPEGNGIVLGAQVVYDSSSELTSQVNYKVNLDSSFQSTASSTPSKPDFGKNIFLILHQLSVYLPLKRMEKLVQNNASMAPILPESLLNTSNDSSFSSSKKHHAKLHLNPNAPLFSQVDQTQPNSFAPPGSSNPNAGSFNQGFNPQGASSSNSGSFNPNTFFNAPLFNQAFHFDQPGANQFQASSGQYQQQQQDFNAGNYQQGDQNILPPGLVSPNVAAAEKETDYGTSNYYAAPPRMQNNPLGRNRGLHVDTRLQSYVNHVIVEDNQEYVASGQNTPCMPEGEGTGLDRQKSKGSSLYAAVLSNRKNDGSIPNSPCPSVTKLKREYFGCSTPGSERGDPSTPLIGGGNEPFEVEETGNVLMTEDMIENFKLDDHLGHLVEFAKTYNGSRLLQKFFPRANQNEVEHVINEIEDHIDELMLDPYANYMFQTLAQSCSADQRFRLLQEIAPSMVRVAGDRKGTHSLQAIVSLISRDVEEKLIRDALHGHIVELAFDPQGTHLVQKLIVAISVQNLGFLYQPLLERFLDVVNHSFGLCVLKQLMTKVEKSYELKRPIVEMLYENFENLIQNPYGNYALQHAMDVWPNDCNILLEKATEKVVQYSNQKFSSNVIEKCIVIAPLEIRKKYLYEIVKSDRLAELMKNKYGNYVLLKLLSTLDTEGKQLLIQHISKNLNHVNVVKYRSRWAQFIDDNPMKIPNAPGVQTGKPSIFKNASLAESNSSSNRDQGELNSPGSAELWNNTLKKKSSFKDDKSQFYYESGKTVVGQRGFNSAGEEMESYQSPDYNKNSRRLNDSNQNVGSGSKKGKPNQKFYSDKGQHHMSKGGHSNFC